MNFDLKKIIYTVISVFFIVLIIKFFINIFPYILIAGLVIYGVLKIKSFLSLKKNEKNTNSIDNNNYSSNSNEFYSEENDFSGEIIDVDYEESDDKN